MAALYLFWGGEAVLKADSLLCTQGSFLEVPRGSTEDAGDSIADCSVQGKHPFYWTISLAR